MRGRAVLLAILAGPATACALITGVGDLHADDAALDGGGDDGHVADGPAASDAPAASGDGAASPPGEGGASPTDASAPNDASVAICARKPFLSVTKIAELATNKLENTPRLTPDELRIVFHSQGTGGGAFTVMEATRASRTAPFSPAANVLAGGTHPTLSADGLTLFYDDGDPQSDHKGIRYAKRSSLSDAFNAAAGNWTDGVTPSGAFPVTTPSGDMWIAAQRPQNAGGYDIYFVAGGGAAPAPNGLVERAFPELATSADEFLAAPSADGRELFFTRGSGLVHGIWVAWRSDPAGSFDPPTPVSFGDASLDYLSGWLSPDSCRLYFASNAGGAGLDLYVAQR